MIRSILSVGGWTLISRATGFARDVTMAAIMGAGPIADAFVVAWGLFWWWAGRLTDTTIRAIAEPSRHVAGALRQMRDNIGGAAGRVGEIPYVGGDVRVPFDRLTGDVDGMIASADGQVHAIENAATLMGWVTFALPLLLLIIIWLPWRLRFVRRSSATLALVRQTGPACHTGRRSCFYTAVRDGEPVEIAAPVA